MNQEVAPYGQVAIRVKEFETRYRTISKIVEKQIERDGKVITVQETKREELAEDFVTYVPSNNPSLTTITKPMDDIINILPLDDPHNPTLIIAHNRKNAILPYYEAWKTGNEIPETGTPLSAWADLNKKQVDILRHAGFKTVEDIAEALDSTLGLVKLPNPRDIRTRAQRYVAAKAQNNSVELLTQTIEENKSLKDEIAEMKMMLRQQAQREAEREAREREEADKRIERQNARQRRAEAHEKEEVAA